MSKKKEKKEKKDIPYILGDFHTHQFVVTDAMKKILHDQLAKAIEQQWLTVVDDIKSNTYQKVGNQEINVYVPAHKLKVPVVSKVPCTKLSGYEYIPSYKQQDYIEYAVTDLCLSVVAPDGTYMSKIRDTGHGPFVTLRTDAYWPAGTPWMLHHNDIHVWEGVIEKEVLDDVWLGINIKAMARTTM